MDTNVMLSAIIFRSANAVRTIELASGRDHGLGRREDRQPFHHITPTEFVSVFL